MKEYRIYWIKEEFARHYYFKSDILYRFLREYHIKKFRNDLSMQFNFITENFPKNSLISQFKMQPQILLHKNRQNDDFIELSSEQNYISLHITEKQIKFRCETLQDAENLLFPTLRRFHLYLFIVDDHYENFGWISPVKSSMEYNEQLLYS